MTDICATRARQRPDYHHRRPPFLNGAPQIDRVFSRQLPLRRREIRDAYPPKAVSHCHCQQCRKSHGAAFASYGSVPRSDLRIQAGADNITSFKSSESVSRQFCARCGSSLFWSRDHGDYSDWISIALGCLDSTFTPTKQKQTHLASTAAWYALDDRTENPS